MRAWACGERRHITAGHARARHIGDELALAAQEARVFLARTDWPRPNCPMLFSLRLPR